MKDDRCGKEPVRFYNAHKWSPQKSWIIQLLVNMWYFAVFNLSIPSHTCHNQPVTITSDNSIAVFQCFWPTKKEHINAYAVIIIVAPSFGVNYRVIGPVCVSVCVSVSVCLWFDYLSQFSLLGFHSLYTGSILIDLEAYWIGARSVMYFSLQGSEFTPPEISVLIKYLENDER